MDANVRVMTFKQIIQLWPSHQSLADRIGQPVDTVRKWHQRNRVPATVWLALIKSAADEGLDLTLEDLCLALESTISER